MVHPYCPINAKKKHMQTVSPSKHLALSFNSTMEIAEQNPNKENKISLLAMELIEKQKQGNRRWNNSKSHKKEVLCITLVLFSLVIRFPPFGLFGRNT